MKFIVTTKTQSKDRANARVTQYGLAIDPGPDKKGDAPLVAVARLTIVGVDIGREVDDKVEID